MALVPQAQLPSCPYSLPLQVAPPCLLPLIAWPVSELQTYRLRGDILSSRASCAQNHFLTHIHLAEYTNSSFLSLLAEFLGINTHDVMIHPPVDKYLAVSRFGAIMNQDTMNFFHTGLFFFFFLNIKTWEWREFPGGGPVGGTLHFHC